MTNYSIVRNLSSAAQEIYDNTDPLEITAAMTDAGLRYNISGALEVSGLASIDEVSRALEEWSGEVSKASAHRISIDNGVSFVSPEEAIAGLPWETIAHYMDDSTREAVAIELAPCTELEFLTRYLEIADEDLIIG